jgi:hypothetical protein
MTDLRRSPFIVVALAVGLLAAVVPGRAQQDDSRFFYADTTLLRDTLDLKFDRLFELADSLRVRPDTLRSIAVRFHVPLSRIVWLADSLGQPVDSVGPIMEREQFNPLSSSGERLQTFGYQSTYTILQTSTTWANNSGYKLVRDALFLNNTTDIGMDRFRIGGRTSLRQTRQSVTELGWKLSQNLSLGGRANLRRFDTRDPGSISNEGETINEFQFSTRSRQQPGSGVTSELNLFTGLLDVSSSTLEKRGVSGDLNGRVRFARDWFTHDLNGQFTGNLSRTSVPGAIERSNTNDNSQNLRGTLGLFPSRPIGANLNYSLRRVRVDTPTDSGPIQQNRTDNSSVDLNVRVRRHSEATLNVGGSYRTSRQSNTLVASAQNSREDLGFTSDARYRVFGWLLESRFGASVGTSEFPRRSSAGGYGESLGVRSFEVTAQRSLTPKIVTRGVGSVSLNRFRYYSLGGDTPVPRDQYRQSYRMEGTYTYSQNINTSLALEVARSLFVNIPSASTGANNEERTYRAEWRWTYRLLPGLTANQNNQILANYTFFTFNPIANRLSLDYTSRTILNAVITPRLSLDLIHSARYQPSGDYLEEPDGFAYFGQADETENFTLGASMNYAPSRLLSITLSPEYQSSDRRQTLDGALSPQRESRTLNFSGGANINLPVGRSGRLTGTLRRSYRGDRSTTYPGGVETLSPRGEVDYWNGSLVFSWDLQ